MVCITYLFPKTLWVQHLYSSDLYTATQSELHKVEYTRNYG